ncbi:hypothetical protein [Marinivivus vitaminiproducens]|uniref:hypothetical protein n=1 Tax=Marinivivus vitaminiproducens TaxID=3035935 RepID=UPI0027A5CB36|nr:hypothetical protein P4R82_10070 [Geminicoccaceae bacterium SCSIO 64248]
MTELDQQLRERIGRIESGDHPLRLGPREAGYVIRTTRDRIRDRISVAEFGARGNADIVAEWLTNGSRAGEIDGGYADIDEMKLALNLPWLELHDTIDTVAGSLAIRELARNRGGTLDWPAGTYSITYPLFRQSKVLLRGAGKNATTLRNDQSKSRGVGYACCIIDGQLFREDIGRFIQNKLGSSCDEAKSGSVTLRNVSGYPSIDFADGEIVCVWSGINTSRRGQWLPDHVQICRVTSVDKRSLWLDAPLRRDLRSGTAGVGGPFVINLSRPIYNRATYGGLEISPYAIDGGGVQDMTLISAQADPLKFGPSLDARFDNLHLVGRDGLYGSLMTNGSWAGITGEVSRVALEIGIHAAGNQIQAAFQVRGGDATAVKGRALAQVGEWSIDNRISIDIAADRRWSGPTGVLLIGDNNLVQAQIRADGISGQAVAFSQGAGNTVALDGTFESARRFVSFSKRSNGNIVKASLFRGDAPIALQFEGSNGNRIEQSDFTSGDIVFEDSADGNHIDGRFASSAVRGDKRDNIIMNRRSP